MSQKWLSKITGFIVIALFITSCKKENLNSSIIIDLDLGKSHLASDFIEDIDYVLLDYSDQKPIVNPYKMLFTDNHILVESRETAAIFIFDAKGNLQTVIQNYGDGPGEFRLIDEMFLLDNDRFQIHVYHLKKYIIFNFQGNLLEEGKLKQSTLSYPGKDFWLFHFPKGEENNLFTLTRVTESDTSGYAPARSGMDQFYSFGYVHGFVKGRGEIIFKEEYTSQVFRFNTNSNLKDSLSFDFGKYNLDWETKVRLAKDSGLQKQYFEENKKVRRISSFFSMPSGYFLSASYDYKNPHWVLLDSNLQVKKIVAGIENDIDEMPLKQRTWTYYENFIIYQLDSRTFFNDYVTTFQGQKVDLINSKVHKFFDINKEKLKEEKTVLVKLKLKDW